jgi:small-conductance mechanosensitive channel
VTGVLTLIAPTLPWLKLGRSARFLLMALGMHVIRKMKIESISLLVVPIGLVLAGYLVGKIFQNVAARRLTDLAKRSGWQDKDVIVAAVASVAGFWCTLLGLHTAVMSIPLRPDVSEYLRKLIMSGYVISATFVVARIAVGYVHVHAAKVPGILPSTTIFSNITRVAVYSLGALVLLQSLGIPITPVLGALGVGGLAVALALQDTLSNLFSGLHLIASRQVRPGDFIQLDSGEEGYVTDVTWRNTTIRELGDNMMIVPNSKLAASRVRNYCQPNTELAVSVEVGVDYSSPLEKVERITTEVAREVMEGVPGGVPSFEPLVRYHRFGDYSVDFTVTLRAKEFTDQELIKHEFIKRLHERYEREGIEIPPRLVYTRNEQRTSNRQTRASRRDKGVVYRFREKQGSEDL